MKIPAVIARIETIVGFLHYAVLECTGDFVSAQSNRTSTDYLYFYDLDPLTSEVQSCLAGVRYAEICSIREIGELPIEEDYQIDSLQYFYDGRLSKTYVEPEVDPRGVSERFWKIFHAFLVENQRLILVRHIGVTDALRKLDFTDLGIDFMRQHYRRLKAAAIRSDGLADKEHLHQFLQRTQENRTTAADWRNEKELLEWLG